VTSKSAYGAGGDGTVVPAAAAGVRT